MRPSAPMKLTHSQDVLDEQPKEEEGAASDSGTGEESSGRSQNFSGKAIQPCLPKSCLFIVISKLVRGDQKMLQDLVVGAGNFEPWGSGSSLGWVITCLSPPRGKMKWVPPKCQGNLTNCRGMTYNRLTFHPKRVATDKHNLWQLCVSVSQADLFSVVIHPIQQFLIGCRK